MKENFIIRRFLIPKKVGVEMHLIAKVKHSVKIFDEKINFVIGESIHTENSYKYTYKTLKTLVESAGYEIQNFYSDKKDFFGVFILKVKK